MKQAIARTRDKRWRARNYARQKANSAPRSCELRSHIAVLRRRARSRASAGIPISIIPRATARCDEPPSGLMARRRYQLPCIAQGMRKNAVSLKMAGAWPRRLAAGRQQAAAAAVLG